MPAATRRIQGVLSAMQLPFNMRRDLKMVFATPMGTIDLPGAEELNPRIAEVILAREKADGGLQRSNKGGWHSGDDLLTWPELQFADLADTFRSATSHMIAATSGKLRFNVDLALIAWAIVNRPGAFNSPHVHPENHWSGVYYVQTSDFSVDPINKAGQIEFADPRAAAFMVRMPEQKDLLSLTPLQGTIVMFPSWLHHWVNPFSIDSVRISIAFNARIRKFQALD
jgi:uncharacterized protein (TIGR02466 family)